MTEDTLFLPGLSPVESLDIHARFDGGALSSDGGVQVLREIERRLALQLAADCGRMPPQRLGDGMHAMPGGTENGDLLPHFRCKMRIARQKQHSRFGNRTQADITSARECCTSLWNSPGILQGNSKQVHFHIHIPPCSSPSPPIASRGAG